jgi:sugar O-acyltransferase (sialic acid O-acetyltransferase NeuD family)
MRPLLIIGAGGFGRETLNAVRAVNEVTPTWAIEGFLDDDRCIEGCLIDGVPVIGPISAVDAHPDADAVVTIGNPDNYTSRRTIVSKLNLQADRWATIIHPAAVVAPGTQIGPGTVILAGAVTTSPVRIGAHVVVMPAVVLTHDNVVSDYATLASGARLAGGVNVGEGAYLGAGALVREHRTIGAWALIGMGAAVTMDVPPGEVWAGLPARRLRRVAVLPSDLFPAEAVSGPATGQGR